MSKDSKLISNSQQSLKNYEMSPPAKRVKLADEKKSNNSKSDDLKSGGASDQFLNKINIALSDSGHSQNIECKIESGSMHEITISSRTNEKVTSLASNKPS